MILEVNIETFIFNALYILHKNNIKKLSYGGLVEYKDAVQRQLEEKGIELLYNLDGNHQQSIKDYLSDVIYVGGSNIYNRWFALQPDLYPVVYMNDVINSQSPMLYSIMQSEQSKEVLLLSNSRYLTEIDTLAKSLNNVTSIKR